MRLKMWIATVLFLYISCSLFIAIGGADHALVDYRTITVTDVATKAIRVPTKCENGVRVICQDCKNLTQCISTGTGEFNEVLIQSCGPSQTCKSGVCATDPSTTCSPVRGMKFPCQEIGTFPDPADCKKFAICPTDSGEVDTLSCARNGNQDYGFNVKSLLCTNKLLNNNCPGLPIPLCTKLGQHGPLPGNPSYYYLCITIDRVLYPVQSICPFGRVFTNGKGCV